ncbi:PHOsphatase [Phlyctochytrium bullatum]|nr:PHOsphatase [Phlyctochytrium bullatum]
MISLRTLLAAAAAALAATAAVASVDARAVCKVHSTPSSASVLAAPSTLTKASIVPVNTVNTGDSYYGITAPSKSTSSIKVIPTTAPVGYGAPDQPAKPVTTSIPGGDGYGAPDQPAKPTNIVKPTSGDGYGVDVPPSGSTATSVLPGTTSTVVASTTTVVPPALSTTTSALPTLSSTTATPSSSTTTTAAPTCTAHPLLPPVNPVGAILATVDARIAPGIPTKDIRLGTKSRYPIPASVPAPLCPVIQVHVVARHGTRNPSKSDLKRQTALKNAFKANPPKNLAAYPFLATFDVPSSAAEGALVLQGARDHALLAGRIKERYPNVVADPARVYWQATNVSRAIASGDAFADALYADAPAAATAAKTFLRAAVVPEPIDADLRPYDACEKYVADVEEAEKAEPWTVYQQAKFPAIAERVSKLIGYDLTVDDVTALLNVCSFEVIVAGNAGAMCTLFTEEEFAVYDYFLDLDDNVAEGYGIEINNRLACSLVTAIDQAFPVKDSCEAPAATFRFAHGETILALVTTLGLFRDEFNLTPDLAADKIAARKMRWSAIAPMASNVVVEVLGCEEGVKVRVLVNEVPVVVPGCAGVECEVATWRKALEGKIGCGFEEVCGNKFATVGAAGKYKRLADVPMEEVLAAIARK